MTVASFPVQMRWRGLIKASSHAPSTKVNPNTSAPSSHCQKTHGKAIAQESQSVKITLMFWHFIRFKRPELFLKLFTSNLRHDTFILQFYPHFTPVSIHNPNTIHPFKDFGCYDGPGLLVQSYLNKNNTLPHPSICT